MDAANWVNFEPATTLKMVGLVYLLMAATVWALLDHRQPNTGLGLWCLGSVATAVGGLLFAFRDVLPYWATVLLGNVALCAAYPLRVVALQREMHEAQKWQAPLAFFTLTASLFFVAATMTPALRVKSSIAIQCLGTAYLAWTATRVWRKSGLRGALFISRSYIVYSAAFFVYFVSVVGLTVVPPAHQHRSLVLLLVLLIAAATGIYSNFGYVGMTVERLRKRELEQTAALAQEATQRQAAQEHAVQLQQWLNERDDLVRVLAHEVRQPLNNASAALQSACVALTPSAAQPDARSATAVQRVQRAQSVLGQIIGSLDNTLAVTALLASPERVAQNDADIDLLVQLSLGDLDAAQRPRVQIERLSQTRTAMMDAGLMRLALRNLLSNALSYSRPDSPVVLRITDSDEPLAVVFDVIDSGPGVAPELAPRLFQRGERGTHDRPGHGLGLYVVMRVAELHGGKAEMQQREGGGSIFRLWLTQG